MSVLARDGVLYKKIIIGVLAAGAGVTIYYGYIKWKSRTRSGDGRKPPPSDLGKTEEVTKPDTESSSQNAPAHDVASDPTPVLQPKSPSSPPASGPSSLSVSGTFEKLSLSAFQEHAQSPASGAAGGVQSPTSGFETVPLGTPDLRNLDAPVVTEVAGGEIVSPAGGRHPDKNGRLVGPGSPVGGATGATGGRTRTEMKVNMAGAVKQEPVTAKNSISIANIPKSTQPSDSTKQAKPSATGAQSTTTPSTKSDEEEEDDSDEEEEDSDEEDDESDDSQEAPNKND